ncbi:1-acyl-sn-glycerol-3-phosphate acyltransferase 1-chloroplastic [Striga hermonthica]|uniref:1-acyl-sn-glycerol-3-phosphate acyltransferase n=1 Tax=Striga hermonthica TaxID=68872 RepID=A0A9N7MCB3_STRHE|nr:1-acyl-sn-glycerol-3-phosphate acyltransferase 1-chloroplastic [Striga hermonthica]
MELSLQFRHSNLHSCPPFASLHHPCKRDQRVFVGRFSRPLASHNGFHFSCCPRKQPVQRYSRNHIPPLKILCCSRPDCFPTRRAFYQKEDPGRILDICESCKKSRKSSRDIVARSELTGSSGASYPLSGTLLAWSGSIFLFVTEATHYIIIFNSEIWLNSKVRGICFYAATAFAAVVLFVPMLLQHPFVLMFDRYRRKAHYLVAKTWAFLTVAPFMKIKYEGMENLPSIDTPAIYVSNHQSFLDIYTLLTLGRSFKFISKTSIFLYPIIGWAMFLLGVIPLKRMDSRSQLDCLKQCITLIKKGASVFFFPEGTRSKDGKLGTFKKGAFSVASKTGVPVIPIALIGTGDIMPAGREGILNPGSVKVIVHPPIGGNNPDELCTEARNVIAGALNRQG